VHAFADQMPTGVTVADDGSGPGCVGALKVRIGAAVLGATIARELPCRHDERR